MVRMVVGDGATRSGVIVTRLTPASRLPPPASRLPPPDYLHTGVVRALNTRLNASV